MRGLNRDVRLFLVPPLILGLTIWGGISAVLTNLYLIRLGYGATFIGLLNSVGAASMAVFALPSAALGRRFGCRRVMVVGLVICSAGNGMIALAGLLDSSVRDIAMPAAQVLASFGLDLYLVNAGPLLMNLTSPSERGHAYSLQSAFSPIAAFAGSLTGGVLPSWLGPVPGIGADQIAAYRLALVISAGILMLSALAVAAIREPAVEAPAEPAVTPSGHPVARVAPWGIIGLISLVTILQSAAEGVSRGFINVYLDIGLRVPTPEIGALLSVAQLVAFPAGLVTPLLISRWNDRGVYVRASVGMALSMVLLAMVSVPAGAALGYVGVIALGCVARPCLTMYQYEIVPTEWRTTMSGAVMLAFGFSNAVTSYLAGVIIATSGFANAFLLGAALTAAGGLLFWVTLRGRIATRAAV